MTNKQLSEITGKTPQFISAMTKRLGRLPTVSEILESNTSGRPTKKVNLDGQNCNQLAKICGCYSSIVYRYAKKLGKVPELAELIEKLNEVK